MDYLHPIEALIPGARGQVLSALTRNTLSRTLRQLSIDAGVSWSRTSEIVDDLVDLGLVERRQTPGGVLVRLIPDNVAARVIQGVADLRSDAIKAMRQAAADIHPAPLSLVVFGSFARGTARRDSDIDVLAVAPKAVTTGSSSWEETMGCWVAATTTAAGNPVKLIQIGVDELAARPARRPGWLQEASDQGILLAGKPLSDLLSSHKGRRRG